MPPLPLQALVPRARKQLRKLRRARADRSRRRALAERRLTLDALPAHVSLEMTARCNLNCFHCRRFHFQEEYSDRRGVFGAPAVQDVVGSSGYLDPEVFERCLDLIRDAHTVEFAGYGEPMMNPHFHDYVRRVKGLGHYTNMITNGTLLTEGNVAKLIDNRFDLISVSIDGGEKETLRLVRGIDRDLLFAGLQRLQRQKAERGLGREDAPRLSVSFVMARFNIREMPTLVRELVHLGLSSFYAQNLEAVDAPETLGPFLLHTDPEVRAEAARIVEETEAICREHGIASDIQHIPLAGEGWEPDGVALDDAFERLARIASERVLERRQYLSLEQIAAERSAAAAAAAPADEGLLPPLETAKLTHLTEEQRRENERCIDFFRYAFVAWNGKVLSCCFERYAVGDLNLQSADEVWNGAEYRRLRAAYFERGIRSVCDGCAKILA